MYNGGGIASTLPITGSSWVWIAVAGVTLVAAGFALYRTFPKWRRGTK